MSNTDNKALLETIKNMTVGELVDFLKLLEEELDIKPNMVAAPTQAAATTNEPAKEEAAQTEFTVTLESFGEKKIDVIKEVRNLTSLGLKDAKALVDAAPKVILEKVDKETSDKAKQAIESVGGTVTVK